ncbi:acetyl-CoA C-acyltransferase [Thermodesulfobacteriota bacterium]
MRDVVIISAVRTPIGDFNGMFKDLSAVELGSTAITAGIQRAGLTGDDVDEVIMGNVLPAGLGQNPARQAMLRAGLPMDVGCLTINKVCGSGLKAVMLGAQAIACGDADVVVAGGMENMNQAPFYLEKGRYGYRMGNAPVMDCMINDGIWDVVNDYHMGYTAELVSEKFGISREDMDSFALMSTERALESMSTGRFAEEIVPVSIPRRKGDPLLADTDETPRKITPEVLARLRPAFKKDGRVTAGNASKISDGAAALVLMEKQAARKRGIPALAAVGAQGSAGMQLEDVLVTPSNQSPRCSAKQAWRSPISICLK